jgi:hypothetical protein
MEELETTYLVASHRFKKQAALGISIALIPFLVAVTSLKLTLFRSARPDGIFSNFFDLQARALISGRFDLPFGVLNIESFIYDERTYTYFPPFPAFIRIPLFILTNTFDGRLTALSMVLAWVLMMLGTAGFIWQLRKIGGSHLISNRGRDFRFVLFMIAVGGGSIVLYLGSLPWVYHEVYMWSIATSILSAWCALRLIEAPTWQRCVDLTLLVSACILTRTTVGFGCVVMALGCAVVLHRRRTSGKRNDWLKAFIPAGIAMLLACTVTLIKFGSPFNFLPLNTQVWTRVNEQRQIALAANGGGLTNLKFLLTTIPTYFDPRGIRFIDWFPYITLPSNPPKVYGSAVFDQTYRTGSVTAFMPGLCLLSLVSMCHFLRSGRTSKYLVALVPFFGAAVSVLGILNYGYIAHRYLGDVMPILIISGAIGLVVMESFPERRWSMRFLASFLFLATVWSVTSNSLVAATASAQIAEGSALRSFVNKQVSWPSGSSEFVNQSSVIPETSDADELFVLGDCRALLFGTGESSIPWVLLAGNSFSGTFAVKEGTIPLINFENSLGENTAFSIEIDQDKRIRVVSFGLFKLSSNWLDSWSEKRASFRVSIDHQRTYWKFEIGRNIVLTTPTNDFNEQWEVRYFVPSRILQDKRVAWDPITKDDLCRKVLEVASQ